MHQTYLNRSRRPSTQGDNEKRKAGIKTLFSSHHFPWIVVNRSDNFPGLFGPADRRHRRRRTFGLWNICASTAVAAAAAATTVCQLLPQKSRSIFNNYSREGEREKSRRRRRRKSEDGVEAYQTITEVRGAVNKIKKRRNNKKKKVSRETELKVNQTREK